MEGPLKTPAMAPVVLDPSSGMVIRDVTWRKNTKMKKLVDETKS